MPHLVLVLMFGSDVEALSSPDYLVREKAEARLTYYGDLTWPLLEGHQKDLEASRRARRVLERVWGNYHPPIAVIIPDVLPEWGYWIEGRFCRSIGTKYYKDSYLTYLHTITISSESHKVTYRGGLPGCLANYYGEKCRTQYEWRDWQSSVDSREATRLFCSDLKRFGVPPCLVRSFLRHLEARERVLGLRTYQP